MLQVLLNVLKYSPPKEDKSQPLVAPGNEESTFVLGMGLWLGEVQFHAKLQNKNGGCWKDMVQVVFQL